MLTYRLIFAMLALCAVSAYAAEKNTPISAIAYIEGPASGNLPPVKGTVNFTQNACGESVYISVYITGLAPGKHGFHVHEKGDLTNGCLSTGSHFNPDKMDHGAPGDEVRHVGDLGNIEADQNGVAQTSFHDSVLSLVGKSGVVGRGLVVHADIDDLGKTTHPDSKKTGNAGGRVACGVIGLNMNSDDLPCRDGGANAITLSVSLITFVVAAILLR